MARKTYDDETKSRARADFMAGDSAATIGERYEVPESTVKDWVRGYKRIVLVDVPTESVPSVSVSDPKKETTGPDSLEAAAHRLAFGAFNANLAILELTEDRAWLAKQTAGELAIFFGVISDKLYRLLPAFTKDDSNG